MALETGINAPDFKGITDEEKEVTLDDLKGKWTVLYFYPKDNTPGCTKEACSFRDLNEEIQEEGARVYGVSPDSVKSHKNFKEKHNLNFPLISDPEKDILQKYDAYGEKKMFGKTKMGVIRSTYIIDPEGEIKAKWSNVKVKDHTEKVLDKLKKLKGE